ncbi:MAG TPA: RidA family protein [Xanthobacteraceae bacterium]|jgi:enamine deaminase RidA (YjgF/YER057c/UK114 family)|nr:RidA family protein [Xanthobacteraceae bacterium]
MNLSVEQRLAKLGITLPDAPLPLGSYVRGVSHQGIWHLSGQLPILDGKVQHAGRLGANLSLDEGRAAARQAAINALAQIKYLTQAFSRFEGLLRVDGLVACTAEFIDHATVLDASSEFFVEALGDLGRHARSASGVISLPRGSAVELVVTFAGSGAHHS